MTREDFYALCNKCNALVKKRAPIDTGNLRYNAINGVFVNENTYEITVKLNIAPYMPYTNEPWISPKWNGKKNPNEGWWEKVAQELAELIRKETNGDMIKQ